ncbi:MAG TPA: hypothetical protein PLU50_04205 [Pseudobdellovibrionaceae bacterium]|nr:hypothetical protein [Pseudobdellovibrionaceae bacterium]
MDQITAFHPEILSQIQLALKLTDNIAKESVQILSPRTKISQTPFGRVFYALMTLDQGARDPNFRGCQTYQKLEKEGELKVSLTCQKNLSQPLVEINWSAREKSIRIFSDSLKDVIGDAASILAKTIECRYDQKDTLKSFHCRDYYLRIDEKTVLAIEKIKFERDRDSLVTLNGKWLDQLFPVKSFDATIPQTGKIKVTEKILFSAKNKKSDASVVNSRQNPPVTNPGGLDAKEKSNHEKSDQKSNDESSKENNQEGSQYQQKYQSKEDNQKSDSKKSEQDGNNQSEVIQESQGKASETNIETEQNQYQRPRGGR